jgi:hypothetical protein
MVIKVGNDEFCLFCMEWREFDEKGRCKVCKQRIIRKVKKQDEPGYNGYKSESPAFEMDQESEIDEF